MGGPLTACVKQREEYIQRLWVLIVPDLQIRPDLYEGCREGPCLRSCREGPCLMSGSPEADPECSVWLEAKQGSWTFWSLAGGCSGFGGRRLNLPATLAPRTCRPSGPGNRTAALQEQGPDPRPRDSEGPQWGAPSPNSRSPN